MTVGDGRVLTQGQVLWSPPADARERFLLGRFMDWLRSERGLELSDYEALRRWSIADLEGFWAAVWDFFEIRAPRRLGRRQL